MKSAVLSRSGDAPCFPSRDTFVTQYLYRPFGNAHAVRKQNDEAGR